MESIMRISALIFILAALLAAQDAEDCATLFDAGVIKAWDMTASLATTQCQAIDFGDDPVSGD
jgi:hypothetical protein